jgi:multiple sugar transport system substrate-binding protein
MAGSAGALALVAACGGGGGSGSSGATVRWLNDETDPSSLSFLKSLVQEYNKHAGVSLQLDNISIGDKFTKVVASARAGRSYDMSFMGLPDAYHLTGLGLTTDLDKVVQAAGGESAFLPNTLFKISGHYRWFCNDLNLANIYYRKDWLEEAGLDIPRTWDELVKVCQAFKQHGHGGITQPMALNEATAEEGAHILYSNDVQFLDKDGNVILDQGESKQRAVESLQFLKQLSPYFPKGMTSADFPQIIDTFVSEIAGITPYSGRLLETIIDKAPKLEDKIVVGGYPTKDGKKPPVVLWAADGFVALKQGPHHAEAIDFLAWFVKNRLVDWLLTLPLQLQPALKSIYDDKKWLANDQVHKFKWYVDEQKKMASEDGYQIAHGPGSLAPDLKSAKIFDAFTIGKMYQQTVLQGTPPSQVVDQAAQDIRKLLKS